MSSLVVHHETHIHPLTRVGYGKFTCDGCKTYGFGKTYRCTKCDYNLHDHCATCSSTLLSFMHPEHDLQLVLNGPTNICNICHEVVEGLYYHCEACSFHAHPLCSEQPQHVRYVPHQAHLLKLSHCGTSNTCMVCQGHILSWRYKCDPCMLDVHIECVNSSEPDATSSQLDLHSSLVMKNVSADTVREVQIKVRQASGPSKRKRVFGFLKDLTVDIVCNIIAEMEAELGL